jgi:exonuclease SbcC
MIRCVRLKNWRSHLNSELTFSKGVNALLGAIGTGKTSVLDAICFALFGTFPVLQSKKIKLDDVIMSKPSMKDKAEVELEFEFNNKSYSIRRVIERGKGTTYSEIREDGKLLEAPNSFNVTEVVEKILKVNYELFTKAVYSEQNQLDYFLTLPKGQRKKKFDELLMLDKFENARANTVTLINRIADRKDWVQKEVEKVDVEEMERTLVEIKKSLEKILSDKKQYEKNLIEAINEKNFLEKEVAKLKEIEETLEKLRQRESAIKGKVEEILVSIKSLEEELKGKYVGEVEEELKKTKEKIGELEISLKDKRIQHRKFSDLEAEQRVKFEEMKNGIQQLEKEVEEKLRIKAEFEEYKKIIKVNIEKELVEKKQELSKLNEEIGSTKSKINETENILKQLNLIKEKCPLCQSRLTNKKREALVQHREQHLKALNLEMVNLLERKAKVENELKQLENLKSKWDEMKLELRDLEKKQAELQKLKEEFSKIEEALPKTASLVKNFESEINEIENELKEKNKLREELEVLLLKFKEYGERIAKLQLLKTEEEKIAREISEKESLLAGKNLEGMENRLKELVGKIKECEVNISRCEDLAKEKVERIKEYEKKLEEVKKQKEEIKKLEKILRELKIFEQALMATQVELREEFIEAINYYMKKIWSTLYPYGDFVGIRLAVEEGDYVLQLEERSGRFINADGIASGGERNIACLALRIAFSTVLAPQLRLLVLDEPTHNLDVKSVEVLAQTLRERISELTDQVFIISHDEKLEEAITGNAYRLERDKVQDGVTIIKQITV